MNKFAGGWVVQVSGSASIAYWPGRLYETKKEAQAAISSHIKATLIPEYGRRWRASVDVRFAPLRARLVVVPDPTASIYSHHRIYS